MCPECYEVKTTSKQSESDSNSATQSLTNFQVLPNITTSSPNSLLTNTISYPNNDMLFVISLDFIFQCPASFMNNKAVGYDSISNEMITNSPAAILDVLQKFINFYLKKHLTPNSWFQDLVNPIFKDSERNDPNNYRGICIFSALLKQTAALLSKI